MEINKVNINDPSGSLSNDKQEASVYKRSKSQGHIDTENLKRSHLDPIKEKNENLRTQLPKILTSSPITNQSELSFGGEHTLTRTHTSKPKPTLEKRQVNSNFKLPNNNPSNPLPSRLEKHNGTTNRDLSINNGISNSEPDRKLPNQRLVRRDKSTKNGDFKTDGSFSNSGLDRKLPRRGTHERNGDFGTNDSYSNFRGNRSLAKRDKSTNGFNSDNGYSNFGGDRSPLGRNKRTNGFNSEIDSDRSERPKRGLVKRDPVTDGKFLQPESDFSSSRTKRDPVKSSPSKSNFRSLTKRNFATNELPRILRNENEEFIPEGVRDIQGRQEVNKPKKSNRYMITDNSDLAINNFTRSEAHAAKVPKCNIFRFNGSNETKFTHYKTEELKKAESNQLSKLTSKSRLDLYGHGNSISFSNTLDIEDPKVLAKILWDAGLREVGVIKFQSCNIGRGNFLEKFKLALDEIGIKCGWISGPKKYLFFCRANLAIGNKSINLPTLPIPPKWIGFKVAKHNLNVVKGNIDVSIKNTRYQSKEENSLQKINDVEQSNNLEKKKSIEKTINSLDWGNIISNYELGGKNQIDALKKVIKTFDENGFDLKDAMGFIEKNIDDLEYIKIYKFLGAVLNDMSASEHIIENQNVILSNLSMDEQINLHEALSNLDWGNIVKCFNQNGEMRVAAFDVIAECLKNNGFSLKDAVNLINNIADNNNKIRIILNTMLDKYES